MHSHITFTVADQYKEEWSVRSIETELEWERYFSLITRPNMPQAYGYGEAKQKAFFIYVERGLIEHAGKPVALFQMIVIRVAGLRLLARINRGPIFIENNPSRDMLESVYRTLLKFTLLSKGCAALVIGPPLEPSETGKEILQKAGFKEWKDRGWKSSLIDVQQDIDILYRRLQSTWRNRLNKSLKSGLELHIGPAGENLAWMLDRHKENMTDKKFRGMTSSFVRALYESDPERFYILKAMFNGTPVAAMTLVQYGNKTEYFIGWFSKEGRRFNAGNFLYWNSLKYAKELGSHWFDLGGYSGNEGYGHIKTGMNGTEYNYIGEWVAYRKPFLSV